jgi:hypothetical protein
MKALLIVFVVLVAFVVGLGFYRGWFNVSSNSADGKSNITFSADPAKMQEDKKKALEEGHKVVDQVKDKIAPSDEKKKDKVAPSEQPVQDKK